jgi:hypothetical protein
VTAMARALEIPAVTATAVPIARPKRFRRVYLVMAMCPVG